LLVSRLRELRVSGARASAPPRTIQSSELQEIT
jgi:hypothetical protein